MAACYSELLAQNAVMRFLIEESEGAAMDRGSTIDGLVGARVRVQRLFTHVTQDELAATLGIGVPELDDYEAGLARFPPDLLVRVAEVLGAKLSQLFQGVDAMAEAAASAATPPGRLIEMQTLFVRLSPSLQDEALAFVRTLASRPGPTDVES